MLHAQFATCLWELKELDLAFEECNRALESAPDQAEFYRTRAFIRANRRQTEGLAEDLGRFELLGRFLPREFFRSDSPQGPADRPAEPPSHRAFALVSDQGGRRSLSEPLDGAREVGDEELDARAKLAMNIREAGAPALAAEEVDKILALDPGHLRARIMRAVQALDEGRFKDAGTDFCLVLDHPDLIDCLRAYPASLPILDDAAERLARRGRVAEALQIVDRMISCSLQLNQPRGRAHYAKAVVLAMAARSDPEQIPFAAEQLQYALRANPRYMEWYRRDTLFDPVRARMDAILDLLPDPPLRS